MYSLPAPLCIVAIRGPFANGSLRRIRGTRLPDGRPLVRFAPHPMAGSAGAVAEQAAPCFFAGNNKISVVYVQLAAELGAETADKSLPFRDQRTGAGAYAARTSAKPAIAGCNRFTDGCKVSIDGCKSFTVGCRDFMDGCKSFTVGCKTSIDGYKSFTVGCKTSIDGCKSFTVGCRDFTNGYRSFMADYNGLADGWQTRRNYAG